MTHRNFIFSLLAGLASTPFVTAHAADFALNWQRVNTAQSTAAPNINCNRGEGSINCGHGGGSDPDKTPFLQEIVRGSDNRNYYHVIVGDPDSGFAQEVFIMASGRSWQGGMGSASGGIAFTANSQSPLAAAAVSGNATGNPTRVVMQQIVAGGGVHQEFLKDEFQFKPLISHTLDSDGVHMEFVADMRHLSLADMSTAAAVTNRITFTDPDSGNAGNFDLAFDAPQSHVNAGQYLWTPGSGPGQSSGSWQYQDGGAFDPTLVDWIFFRHAEENPPS